MSYIYVKREADNLKDFCTYIRESDDAYFEVPCVLDDNNDIDITKTEEAMEKAIVVSDEQMNYME